MAFDPNDPSYSRLSRTGTEQGPGSIIEKVMLLSLSKGFGSMSKMFSKASETKTIKAIKLSTKMFDSIKKAGEHAGELFKIFQLTQTLIGMPGRTATQGLDMLSAQLLAPISGAVSQAIGQAMAALNQIIGPALQQIGKAVGGFVREQPIGAGIGGVIGGVAGAVTGIPGLGIIGGLIGGGIEALVDEARKVFEGDDETKARQIINDVLTRGGSLQNIVSSISNYPTADSSKLFTRMGLTTLADLEDFMGIRGGDQGPGVQIGPIAGGLETVSTGGGVAQNMSGFMEGSGFGGSGSAIITELQILNRTTRTAWVE